MKTEKLIADKIIRIEKHLGIYDELSARQLMEAIGQGKAKNQHVGKKTKEVIAQEIKSALNEQKPETWTPQEANEWVQKYLPLLDDWARLPESDKRWVDSQVKDFKDLIQKTKEFVKNN